jgi:thiosulfate/3-mercaptopyruvate sulfurtransferase
MSLVSADHLAARNRDPRVRIVDIRWYLGRPGEGRVAYDAGHIPGAIFVDVDSDLVAAAGPGRHPLPDPALFAARMGDIGIGPEHEVVVYDDVGGWVAARLWWMLDDLGHRAVSVLDGGYQAWAGGGYPVEVTEPAWPAAQLSVADHWTKVVDRDGLRARLGKVVLLDARAAQRYRGEIEPIDPIAGHIPTARNAPTDGNLGVDGRFLSARDLAARFIQLGAASSDRSAAVGDVVNSCGSGVSACHNALAMRIAGLPDPLLYPGSWSDWSTAGYPVATGPEPGEAPTP